MKPDIATIDKNMMRGKTVLITDGAMGIGESLVRVFVQAGANIAVNVRNRIQFEKLRNFLEQSESSFRLFNFDSLTKETIKKIVIAVRELGRITVLINFCDFEENIPFMQTDEKKWDIMVERHLTTAYRFCSAIVPDMIEAKYGRIVNISSLFAKTGGYIAGAGVHYCAATNGLIGLSRGLGIQLAPYGITVNTLCPSLVDGEAEKTRNTSELNRLRNEMPFSRFADPLEIAGGALFLASPYTSWITGYSLDINGGLFMD
jgi:NAD(P)-dependent dehydrogenase (short-subunit alcohol dehydrogenase family)